jgi:hypothetical protein
MLRSFKTRWSALCLTLALAGIFGCGLASWPDERLWPGQGKQASRRDFAYMYIAWAAESPRPCTLIPEDANSVAAFSSSGTKISLLRSSCFDGVATNSGRADLCDHVKSVSSLLWDGSGLSRERCLKSSDSSGHLVVGGTPQPLEEFMLHLGYSLDPTPDEQCANGAEHDRRTCMAIDLWMSETESKQILDRLHRVETW